MRPVGYLLLCRGSLITRRYFLIFACVIGGIFAPMGGVRFLFSFRRLLSGRGRISHPNSKPRHNFFRPIPIIFDGKGFPQIGKSKNGKHFQITDQKISAAVVKTMLLRLRRDNLGQCGGFLAKFWGIPET